MKRGMVVPQDTVLVLNSTVLVPQYWIMYVWFSEDWGTNSPPTSYCIYQGKHEVNYEVATLQSWKALPLNLITIFH